MDYRILGWLEAADERGNVLSLAGAKPRAVLCLLLLRANRVVSSDVLIEELWAGAPPRNAGNALQAAVSRVRKAIGADRLRAQAPGYVLAVAPGELDLDRFDGLVADGRAALAAGEAGVAADALARALSIWRGPALADFTYEPFAQAEIARLEELRLSAVEERIEADLALGRHPLLVGELETLVGRHPLRERLRGQLMLALYRSGRHAEALDRYQTGRRAIVDELGLEPGRQLRTLEAAILRQDPDLDPLEPEPGPPGPAETARRVATIVFVELVESPAASDDLDPEVALSVLERYSKAVADVFERHGGRVDSSVDDVVMGMFGLPVAREDDALRALRAALDLPERVAGLDARAPLAIRVGIETAEVAVGASSTGRPLVTGAGVASARRLQRAAGPGEAILGRGTYERVRHAARCEPAEDVLGAAAWRLLAVEPDAPAVPRLLDAPLVGRQRELRSLREQLDRCSRERTCRLVAVLGPPGIGKSRLVGEAFADTAGTALVVTGRCLSYGEGITYWPLAEIVRQVAGRDPQAGLTPLLPAGDAAATIADRIAAAVGSNGEVGTSEEIHWAVRRLFEALASARPLVAVFDDLHWAESTFLDLLEYLAGFASGPILLVCMARDDLLESRPSWSRTWPAAETVELGPLTEAESLELAGHLVPEASALREDVLLRAVEVADGNPLFLEQIVALHAEQPRDGPERSIPPTLDTLLASRIDRLAPDERRVVERASIEGRVFHHAALGELVDDDERADLRRVLMALVRRGLVAPAMSDFEGEDAFRFRHALIRDAAYGLVAKERRAELHLAFADWLERSVHGRALESEEIAGYHLEQAHAYWDELSLAAPEARADLAARAAGLLEAAGSRASARGDLPAAAGLLRRAAALLQADGAGRARVQVELGTVLLEAGRLDESAEALAVADAAAGTDARVRAHVTVNRALLALQQGSAGELASLEPRAAAARPLFERDGDRLGLCRLERLDGTVDWLRGSSSAAERAWERAAGHAEAVGARRELVDVLCWLASAAFFGSTPAPEAILRCDAIRIRVAENEVAEAEVVRLLAGLQAMRGRFAEAAELLARSRDVFAGFGLTMHTAVSHPEVLVALLAGDLRGAEGLLRDGYERLRSMGERSLLATTAALLAKVLVAQARPLDAAPFLEVAETEAASDDLDVQIVRRSVRARILAEAGEADVAVTIAGEAVALADGSDWLNHRADARVDLAAALRLLGRVDEAERTLTDAAALYARKGNLVAARRARAARRSQTGDATSRRTRRSRC